MEFSIATWNVNSIRARIRQVVGFSKRIKADVLCIQETKVKDGMFPKDEFDELGYNLAIYGGKGYNGVATISKFPIEKVKKNILSGNLDEKRIIFTKIKDINIFNAYFPNGRSPESEKFQEKLKFIEELKDYLYSNYDTKKDKVILLGDLNVAQLPIDVYDEEKMKDKIGYHPKEREALKHLYDWGFIDTFRLFNKNQQFSWWDYRAASFRKNIGLRIDYIWISEALKSNCRNCYIDKNERGKERPSDHAPVVARFEI